MKRMFPTICETNVQLYFSCLTVLGGVSFFQVCSTIHSQSFNASTPPCFCVLFFQPTLILAYTVCNQKLESLEISRGAW